MLHKSILTYITIDYMKIFAGVGYLMIARLNIGYEVIVHIFREVRKEVVIQDDTNLTQQVGVYVGSAKDIIRSGAVARYLACEPSHRVSAGHSIQGVADLTTYVHNEKLKNSKRGKSIMF